VTRMPTIARTAWVAPVRIAVLLGAAMLAATACSGGAIGSNTVGTSGPNYVASSYSSKYFAPGSRPLAPVVTGTTLDGKKFSLAAEHGRTVVINFWGSWCADCRKEAPDLAALARRFAAKGVDFVGDDVHDYPAAAQAFEQTFNVGYPSLNDSGSQVALAFHSTVPLSAIPSTLVIDSSGRIAARVVGETSYNELRQLIQAVLAGKS
jgi:thiol-disulfide isomerase/thioredoxin